MSAILLGKRSFFEDVESSGNSPNSGSTPVYKKYRCSSATSPVRFSYSPPVYPSCVDQLKALFPDADVQLLEKASEESGNDFESATKKLQELYNSGSTVEENVKMENAATPTGGDALPLKEGQVQNNLPADGAEWVDLLVREMQNATSIDDAKSRAARILEVLEKSISARSSAESAQNIQKENMMLKEQIELLLRDNVILKRAVAIQHERQKEYDEKNVEVQQLKQLVSQYQEQIRSLEMNNYALSLHLRQAQSNNNFTGRFNPDVF